MADTWGNRIKLSIFGESHGPVVGIAIDNLPSGLTIDEGFISREMERRAPGRDELSTYRYEPDNIEILSGVFNGKTTGNSICGIIRNKDTRSGDYTNILRPGHADLTAFFKYGNNADMRGGGHFSGRLTAPLVFAGAIAKLALAPLGVSVYSRITSIGTVLDTSTELTEETWGKISKKDFPVANSTASERMRQLILDCRKENDSVGGVIEIAALGVPAGLGDPFFNSVESTAAHLFFSIPAVKGVEFGAGFALSSMNGSTANDSICVRNGKITTETNRCGGILGGITTGKPIIARLAFKPTPSISKPQKSVNSETLEPVTLEISGRHDPCIVLRALPVAEAALALALLDCLPERIPG